MLLHAPAAAQSHQFLHFEWKCVCVRACVRESCESGKMGWWSMGERLGDWASGFQK